MKSPTSTPIVPPNPGRVVGREVLVMFTRFPEAGRVKTRLVPALGEAGAAQLHAEMTAHAVACVRPAIVQRALRFEIRFDGGTRSAMRHWLGPVAEYRPQSGGHLGQRLHHAAAEAFNTGASAVVIIGSDCPGLSGAIVNDAFAQLKRHPLVLGPASDGGYYLIGLRRMTPELFEDIPWGTDQVLAQSINAARRAGLEPALLPELPDVDSPADLVHWEQERQSAQTVSVIIPTLNEAAHLAATLKSVKAGANPGVNVIVVDGGSTDGTAEEARQLGAEVLVSGRGRARQMNAGAAAARGNILLFLHADTELPDGYLADIHAGLASLENVGGAFSFAIRDAFRGRRWVERATNFRSRYARMPYGDQGIFVRRWAFTALGGFPEYPLMEDYEFVRRLRRLGKITTLPSAVQTSGRRWQRLGVVKTTLINQWIILGYHLGTPPERLVERYRGR